MTTVTASWHTDPRVTACHPCPIGACDQLDTDAAPDLIEQHKADCALCHDPHITLAVMGEHRVETWQCEHATVTYVVHELTLADDPGPSCPEGCTGLTRTS